MNHNILDQFKPYFNDSNKPHMEYSLESSEINLNIVNSIPMDIKNIDQTFLPKKYSNTNIGNNDLFKSKSYSLNTSDISQTSSFSGTATYERNTSIKNDKLNNVVNPNINGSKACIRLQISDMSSYNNNIMDSNNILNNIETKKVPSSSYYLPNILQKRPIAKNMCTINFSNKTKDNKSLNNVKNWLDSTYSSSNDLKCNNSSKLTQAYIDRILCHESMLSDVDDCSNDLRSSISSSSNKKIKKDITPLENNCEKLIVSNDLLFSTEKHLSSLNSFELSELNPMIFTSKINEKKATDVMNSYLDSNKLEKKLPKGHFLQRDESTKIVNIRLFQQNLNILDKSDFVKFQSLIKIINKLTEMKSNESDIFSRFSLFQNHFEYLNRLKLKK